MTISSVGEFTLIDRLAAVLKDTGPTGLLVGIGDDAAAWRPTPNTVTVATTDALVEGVHFDLSTTGWADLGWKALAENVSDVAAMGCWPRYALVALALPDRLSVRDLEDLYRGLQACATAFGCQAVGGDVAASHYVTIAVTLIGESLPATGADDQPPLLRRSAARAGDVVATTGPLGASAAGLRLLREAAGTEADDAAALVSAHLRPMPRVTAGVVLVQAGVRCAIDVSDGLVADLGHICEQSGVDAEIRADRVPLHPAARARFPDTALDMALGGGEDYELVCTGSAEALARASRELAARGEPPLVTIGRILPQRGAAPRVSVLGKDGDLVRPERAGYQHFTHDVRSGWPKQ